MSGAEKLQEDQTTMSLDANKQITLQVGEQRFVTTAETLEESEFLSAQLAERWAHNRQKDGSYFVDADSELFGHILRYLRRGVLPLFHDNVNGHNHALYRLLQREADFFGISKLAAWLKDKKYLEIIKIEYTLEEREGSSWSEIQHLDERLDFHPVWRTEKVYICPRGVPVHRGKLEACGRLCEAARDGAEYRYEDVEVLKTLVVRKKIKFDEASLTADS